MESLDYWRLCDDLTIIQAALLMVGLDPSGEYQYVEDWQPHVRPNGYEAVKAALKGAVRSNKIISIIRYPTEVVTWGESTYNEAGCEIIYSNEPDWHNSTISVESLKKWLISRGFTKGFFFPDTQHHLPYLDNTHPQYAPKLAVAIMAWEEVTNNRYLLKNKSPKKAIESWLETNAEKYGLTKQAIEEIAKIANWNTKGGAPATPSNAEDTVEESELDLEDAIPF